jgi:NAD(P) transhydrogenase beta subunit
MDYRRTSAGLHDWFSHGRVGANDSHAAADSGSLTTTGSLVAFAKLQGLMPGAPMTYKGQNIFNLSLLGVTIGCFVWLFFSPGTAALFYLMAEKHLESDRAHPELTKRGAMQIIFGNADK